MVGWSVIIGFYACFAALIKVVIPVENKDVILVLIGQASAKMGDVVSYFYNTSLGSSRKNDALAKAAGVKEATE